MSNTNVNGTGKQISKNKTIAISVFIIVVFSGFFIPSNFLSNIFAEEIEGTNDDDFLIGTDDDDDIDSEDGDDHNEGRGGDDDIDSDGGDDFNSGDGDDTNTLGTGSDSLDCGGGKDTVTDFQPGEDKIKSCKPIMDNGSASSAKAFEKNKM